MRRTTTPTVFVVPWPPRQLSPNVRTHWSRSAKAKRIYRHACEVSVREQRAKLPGSGPWSLEPQFCAPDRRARDDDNLVAMMKAGIDGIADAFGINDRDLKLAAPMPGAVTPGGCVWVRITELPA